MQIFVIQGIKGSHYVNILVTDHAKQACELFKSEGEYIEVWLNGDLQATFYVDDWYQFEKLFCK